MVCPNCGASVSDVPIVGLLTICPTCLRSIVLDSPIRLAVAQDTVNLSDIALGALRKARKTARQAQG